MRAGAQRSVERGDGDEIGERVVEGELPARCVQHELLGRVRHRHVEPGQRRGGQQRRVGSRSSAVEYVERVAQVGAIRQQRRIREQDRNRGCLEVPLEVDPIDVAGLEDIQVCDQVRESAQQRQPSERSRDV